MMNLRPAVKLTYRSTGNWAFMMFTPPRARFQTRSADRGAGFETPVMDTALAAGLFAFSVAPFVLGMTWAPAKVLTIKRAFARVPGVLYACDRPRLNCVGFRVQPMTDPTSSLALLRTTVHWLIAHFATVGFGWILVAGNPFRMITVWELLQDLFLTLDRPQVIE